MNPGPQHPLSPKALNQISATLRPPAREFKFRSLGFGSVLYLSGCHELFCKGSIPDLQAWVCMYGVGVSGSGVSRLRFSVYLKQPNLIQQW